MKDKKIRTREQSLSMNSTYDTKLAREYQAFVFEFSGLTGRPQDRGLELYQDRKAQQKRIEELEKKLDIAVSALEKCKKIRRKDGNDNEYKGPEAIISEDALKKIKGDKD